MALRFRSRRALRQYPHGTSSVISQEMGPRLADYVVDECAFRFRSRCGKIFRHRHAAVGITPAAAVLVTPSRACASKAKANSNAACPTLASTSKFCKLSEYRRLPDNRFPSDTETETESLGRLLYRARSAPARSPKGSQRRPRRKKSR